MNVKGDQHKNDMNEAALCCVTPVIPLEDNLAIPGQRMAARGLSLRELGY